MSFCYFYQVTARGTLKNYRIFTVLLNFPTKVRSLAEKTVCGIKWARRSYSASSDAAGTGTRKCISFSCLTGSLMLPPTRWATQYGQESKSGLKAQCLPAQHKQLKYFQKTCEPLHSANGHWPTITCLPPCLAGQDMVSADTLSLGESVTTFSC